MSPQLKNEKRPEVELVEIYSAERMTVEKAREQIDNLGENWRSNWHSFEDDGTIILDGQWSPKDLRRIADLWDACHDAEGNER